MSPQRRAIFVSMLVSLLMLGGKVVAYLLTGSAAIGSDAAESVVHQVATGGAAFSVWYGSKAADQDHPYGHGKIAYLSAGFEGAILLCTGLGIVAAAWHLLMAGAAPQQLGLGLLITLALACLNLGLGLWLRGRGRQHRSQALEANGSHVLGDAWTSFGVVLGVALVWATGVAWLDPAVAALVGLLLVAQGGGLLRGALDGLLEKADPEAEALLLATLQGARDRGLVADFHRLRHRRVDGRYWVEVDLLFPDGLSLAEAHGRACRVEQGLREALPGGVVGVTTHLEPLSHEHPAGFQEEP